VKQIDIHYIYTYEDSKMKSTKHCLKDEGREREGTGIQRKGKLIQGTLYACIEFTTMKSFCIINAY
jgi:hypothetical protein